MPDKMYTSSKFAFSDMMVVRVPLPAIMGKAIGTMVLDLAFLSPLNISCPSTISRPSKKITTDPPTAKDRISRPNTFKKGLPTHIDGQAVSMLQAIEIMNKRAGDQGVGRIDMVEDRLVGIKSREVYEAPGAIALITAHQELENVCLERELSRFKRGVEQRWGELVYDGLWFSPLRQALDVFIEETQKHVSGDIRMRLHAGKAVVTGRKSAESLYRYDLATYDSEDTYDQSWAKGFIEIFGMTAKIAADRDRKSK